MGDRGAERAFSFCTLDIDVDPLPIAGAGCELIDAVLPDRDPLRYGQGTSDKLRHRRHAVVRDRHDVLASQAIPRRSLRRILPTVDFGSASRKRISFGTL